MIRILLVDDQRLMRDGLRTLLELEADFEVAGEAGDGQAALDAYDSLAPDVVLMDIRMPQMNGVEATRRLLSRHADARVIILTTFDDDTNVFEGLRAGARGYLLKDLSGSELADAIRTVVSGGALIEPSVARKVFAEFARLAPAAKPADLPEPLSERELGILRLVHAVDLVAGDVAGHPGVGHTQRGHGVIGGPGDLRQLCVPLHDARGRGQLPAPRLGGRCVPSAGGGARRCRRPDCPGLRGRREPESARPRKRRGARRNTGTCRRVRGSMRRASPSRAM